MLIFTRYLGEAFYIGDEIKVSLLAINRKQVRIGITAPKEVPVHREEVYYRTSGIFSANIASDTETLVPVLHDENIKREISGYSLEFTLPSGKSVRINHKDKESLIQAAQALYEKNSP